MKKVVRIGVVVLFWAPIAVLVGRFASGAPADFSGFELGAKATGALFTFDSPSLGVPAKPTGELNIAFSETTLRSGPAGYAIGSIAWPGQVVAALPAFLQTEIETQSGQDFPFDDELSQSGTFQASVEVPDPLGGGTACGRLGEGTNLKTIPWTLTETAENGSLVKATKVDLTLSLDAATNLDSDVFFYDPTGSLLGSATDFNVLTGSKTETISIQDRVFEAGEYKIEVRGCSGAQMSWTLDAKAHYTVIGPAEADPASVSA